MGWHSSYPFWAHISSVLRITRIDSESSPSSTSLGMLLYCAFSVVCPLRPLVNVNPSMSTGVPVSSGVMVNRTLNFLPNGMMGCYSERTRTILIDRRLPYVAKRCTLVHELVHWSHGDDRCGLHEMRTRAETARLLISPTEYALAERMYDGNVWRIADELEVTSGIINDYRTLLHDRVAA